MAPVWVVPMLMIVGVGIIALAWWLARQDFFYEFIQWLGNKTQLPDGKHQVRADLVNASFPADWLNYLHSNVRVYERLSVAEQVHLRDTLRIVLAETAWEGCGGLSLTDEIKITIAAQASILLLGMEHDYFQSVSSILVYPSTFQIPPEEGFGAGIVEEKTTVLGVAWYRGPVILAWDDVLAGGRGEQDGHNVVYHEFAHQLDYLGEWGRQGTRAGKWRKWQKVMSKEYNRLVRDAEQGRSTLLDKYGASNPAEFFAVATECFFEKPGDMQQIHSDLYSVLQEFYGQDPAIWFADFD